MKRAFQLKNKESNLLNANNKDIGTNSKGIYLVMVEMKTPERCLKSVQTLQWPSG